MTEHSKGKRKHGKHKLKKDNIKTTARRQIKKAGATMEKKRKMHRRITKASYTAYTENLPDSYPKFGYVFLFCLRNGAFFLFFYETFIYETALAPFRKYKKLYKKKHWQIKGKQKQNIPYRLSLKEEWGARWIC